MTLDAIPLVPTSSPFGHIARFRDDRLGLLREVGATGPMSRVKFLHRQVVFVSSPETAHEAFVEKAKSFEKSPGLRIMLRELAGEGLFTSEGELWRRQRRLMSPLFHPAALAGYASAMNEEAHRVLARWRDGERLDLAHETMRIAMGVVGQTLFGAGSFDEEDVGQALTVALAWADKRAASQGLVAQLTLLEACEVIAERAPGPVAGLARRLRVALDEPHLLPGRYDAGLRAAIGRLDRSIQQLVEERRRAGDHGRADLLARLLAAKDEDGASMDDRQVRDEATTLFVAGHETTATALAWAFYLLARNPEALAKAKAEADGFGPEGPTSYDPERLAYSTKVFKEALRLYPPVLVFPRRAKEDVTIGGRHLPKRTLVFTSPYAIHTRPELWPDPDRFDPERFDKEQEAARSRSAWIPFGLGPRICIGNHFALMEGPIVLATILRNVEVDIDPARVIEPDMMATLRPRGGVPAVVRHRVARA